MSTYYVFKPNIEAKNSKTCIHQSLRFRQERLKR